MLKSLCLAILAAGFTLFISPAFTSEEVVQETEQMESLPERAINEVSQDSENLRSDEIAFLKIPIKTFA